jgi:hypothetical protein
MVFDEQIKDSAIRLEQVIHDKPWFSSVGLSEEYGRPVFIIYLRSAPGPERDSIPKQWEGFSVRTERIGKLRPA